MHLSKVSESLVSDRASDLDAILFIVLHSSGFKAQA